MSEEKRQELRARVVELTDRVAKVQAQIDIRTSQGTATPTWLAKARAVIRYTLAEKRDVDNQLHEIKKEKRAKRETELTFARISAKQEAIKKQEEMMKAAHERKMARINAAQKDTEDRLIAFKVAAKEMLGDEMYARLWEAATRKLEAEDV